MKKLNKKGFTLIELLAVVVILLAISTIAISSISSAMERNKVKQDEAKKELIVSYAEIYYDDHKNSMENNISDGYGCIMINDLNLSDSEKVDSNGREFNGCVKYESGGKNLIYIDKGTYCCS